MSAALRKARSTFVPPVPGEVRLDRIRSHSARHRCINELKSSNCVPEAGKKFARIASDSVWSGYGKLSEQQVCSVLRRNTELQQLWLAQYQD